MVELWNPLRGFNNVSSLLQLSVSTAVHACWILSCARVQGQPCHIFLFCASYSNAARENDRSHKKSGADESQSKVFACRNWECAALSFSNFLPCASGPERFVWACSYMGTTAAKVLRCPWPESICHIYSQMRRVTAADAQPMHLLAMLMSELDVSPIVHTNRLKWTANIYVASINVPDAGSEHLQVCLGFKYVPSVKVTHGFTAWASVNHCQ